MFERLVEAITSSLLDLLTFFEAERIRIPYLSGLCSWPIPQTGNQLGGVQRCKPIFCKLIHISMPRCLGAWASFAACWPASLHRWVSPSIGSNQAVAATSEQFGEIAHWGDIHSLERMSFRLLSSCLNHFINDLAEFNLFQQEDLSTRLSKSTKLFV